MRWKPVVVQSEDAGGGLVVTLGHPLVDAYLEFLRARARPNTRSVAPWVVRRPPDIHGSRRQAAPRVLAIGEGRPHPL